MAIKKDYANSIKLEKKVNYTLDNPNKITFAFLKTHLWNAADILRGSLDASEYRQPIMTILFLKRLNDTFEENAERLEKKEGKSHKEAWENKYRPYIFCSKRCKMVSFIMKTFFRF